jgi:hypothetical protein
MVIDLKFKIISLLFIGDDLQKTRGFPGLEKNLCESCSWPSEFTSSQRLRQFLLSKSSQMVDAALSRSWPLHRGASQRPSIANDARRKDIADAGRRSSNTLNRPDFKDGSTQFLEESAPALLQAKETHALNFEFSTK